MIELAKASPRIENWIIKWYRGDTFDINFEFIFSDGEGVVISPEETDYLEFTIYNQYYNIVYTEKVYNSHSILLLVDDEETKKFPRGTYFYVIKRVAGYKTTIIQENKVIVE